jgi:hypothetical protein
MLAVRVGSGYAFGRGLGRIQSLQQEVSMSVRYALYENPLPTARGTYRALTQTRGTVGTPEIIERMVLRGSTVGRADMLGVLSLYQEVIESFISEGFRVATQHAVFSLAIQGTFASPTERFEPSRHRLVPVVNTTRALRQAVRRMPRPEKTEGRHGDPVLIEFLDVPTGEVNGTTAPGHLARVSGRRLRYQADDPQQGIFFIPEGHRSGTRVRDVGFIQGGELVFNVPELSLGLYRLEVRAMIRGRLRSGQLDDPLTVLDRGE